MDTNDEFQARMTGSDLAVRLVVAALVKTHPAPEQLLQEIKTQMDNRAELNNRLADPIEKAFDERLHEFTSQLYARISR
jgi:hypothetical protein